MCAKMLLLLFIAILQLLLRNVAAAATATTPATKPAKSPQISEAADCRRRATAIDAQILAVVHDTDDPIIFPLLQALNVSLTFYKDFFKIHDRIDITPLQVNGNIEALGENLRARARSLSIRRRLQAEF